MLNLCYCKCDFNNEAWWSFFATSHGKFPCDDVGETVKKAKIASLQRPMSGQIMAIKHFLNIVVRTLLVFGFSYCILKMIYRNYDLWHPGFCWKVQYLELAFSSTLNPLQYLQLGTNESAKTTISQVFIAFHTTAEKICKLLEMTI